MFYDKPEMKWTTTVDVSSAFCKKEDKIYQVKIKSSSYSPFYACNELAEPIYAAVQLSFFWINGEAVVSVGKAESVLTDPGFEPQTSASEARTLTTRSFDVGKLTLHEP